MSVHVVAVSDHVVKGSMCPLSPCWSHRSCPLGLLSLPPACWGHSASFSLLPSPYQTLEYLSQGQHPHSPASPDLTLAACPLRQQRVRTSLRGGPLYLACKFCVPLKHTKKWVEAGGQDVPKTDLVNMLPFQPREWGMLPCFLGPPNIMDMTTTHQRASGA